MKHSTYKKLYQAHLGVVNETDLLLSRNEESDPFYQNLIDIIVSKNAPTIAWDTKPFTTEFISGPVRQRLDETFFAFVLRTAAIIKEESYIRTYRKPESHQAVLAWISILRNVMMTGLALLYNVKWTPEIILNHLEPTIVKMFSQGDASALRKLMLDLGIKLAQEELYPAELSFEKMSFLQITQFGSFYWRYLHWMAEAIAIRDEGMNLYKDVWLDLLKGPIYRTLRCGICMVHFQNMIKENHERLTYENLPKLFFEMHNKTHEIRREHYKFLQEPNYSESQYEADSAFMRQALLP